LSSVKEDEPADYTDEGYGDDGDDDGEDAGGGGDGKAAGRSRRRRRWREKASDAASKLTFDTRTAAASATASHHVQCTPIAQITSNAAYQL